MFSQQDFNKEVFAAIVRKTGAIPSNEECKAVAHHMEYNIRADRHLANNGHLKISTQELRQRIIQQINQNLHKNDLPRYTDQYRKYKKISVLVCSLYKTNKLLPILLPAKKMWRILRTKNFLKMLI